MRMTIIPSQGVVVIDGLVRGPLALEIDPAIHAVQWNDVRGVIEFSDVEVDGIPRKPPNEPFTDIERFRQAIDAWSAWTPSTPAQPPGSTVPYEITNFQARAVLMGVPGSVAGRSLFDDVDDALRAQGGVAWQAWEYANTITRNGALVQAMAAQFGLAETTIDQLFVQAAAVSA